MPIEIINLQVSYHRSELAKLYDDRIYGVSIVCISYSDISLRKYYFKLGVF